MTLLDTNILLRLEQPTHPLHLLASAAIAELERRGEVLCLVPQVLYEFWVVATRPPGQNGGLGMAAATHAEVTRFVALYRVRPDDPGIFLQWRQLVSQHAVRGKTAHDARLVAAMLVHGIDTILTFNDADFRRFPVVVLTPAQVLNPPGP